MAIVVVVSVVELKSGKNGHLLCNASSYCKYVRSSVRILLTYVTQSTDVQFFLCMVLFSSINAHPEGSNIKWT